MSRNNFYISEMERFLAFLNKLPQTVVKNIENGEKRIEINVVSSSKEPNEPIQQNSIVVSESISHLNSMQSREEAYSYISSSDLKKQIWRQFVGHWIFLSLKRRTLKLYRRRL